MIKLQIMWSLLKAIGYVAKRHTPSGALQMYTYQLID